MRWAQLYGSLSSLWHCLSLGLEWKLTFSSPVDKPRQHIKKQRHHFANKGLYNQSYGFSSSHVWMWEWDHKEGWVLKSWCFWTVVLEETSARRSNQSILKEISPEYSLEGSMLKLQLLWPPDAKSQFIWKNPDAGKDWRQEEKGTGEDEMVGWHHWLNGHEFEQPPGDGEGQGNLACWSLWGRKLSDTTWQLNNDKRIIQWNSVSHWLQRPYLSF